MTLTRQQLDDLLVDYLYDELDAETTSAFEAAVAGHPDLSAEVAAHRRTREASQALPSVAIPAGLLDGVMAEARASAARVQAAAEPSKPWWAQLFAFVTQPAVATAVVACLVLGVGVLVLDDGDLTADRSALQKSPPRVEKAAPAPAPEAAAKAAGAPVPLGPGGVAAAEDTPTEAPTVATVTEPANVAVAAPTRVDESPSLQAGLGNADDGADDDGDLGMANKAEAKARPKANKPTTKAPRRAAKVSGKKKIDAVKGDAPAAGRTTNDLDGTQDAFGGTGGTGGSDAPVYRPAPAATPAPTTPGARPPATSADSAKDLGRSSGSSGGGDDSLSKTGGGQPRRSDSYRSGDAAPQRAPQRSAGAPSADPAPAPAPPAPSQPAPDAPADRALPEVAIPVPGGADDDGSPVEPAPTPKPAPKPAEERVQREALDERSADREEDVETEQEKQQKQDDARASALWRDYDKAVAAGDWSKAEKLLDQIAAIPAQKRLADERRKQLATRRKKASGGAADRATSAPQPAVVPALK